MYLELPYKLIINSSSGVALENGKSTLTASVVKTTDGSSVTIAEEAFIWTRREMSDSFTDRTGSSITITKDDLVDGAGTFICTCKPEEFYWADTAFITIEETIAGTAGQNAPYQRFIFKASVDKPERPSGTCEAIPAGWSLQAPPRLSSEKIWVSTGYVSFPDNEALYSEWSDPAEWSGTSVMPIVQWQWGESSEYPPHVTSYAILIDGELMIFENALFIDDYGEWTDDIPKDHPANLKYLWKREYNWNHTSEEDEWIYYPAQGPSGLPGDYQGLGWYIVGTNTVFFMGLDEDKSPTLSTINIFIGGKSYYFNSISASLNNKSDKFYLVAALGENGIGGLGVYYLKFVSDGTTAETQWLSYDTDERLLDGYVLAEIRMDGYAIESVSIVTPKRLTAYEKSNFMEILDSRDMDDINVAAEAMGIERVFKRLAVLEMFVDELLANEAFIKMLEVNKLKFEANNTLIELGLFKDENGNDRPMFRAAHRETMNSEYETVFQIDLTTGNTFFGKPNSSFSAPLYGFMYNASTHSLVGPNYSGSTPGIQISSSGKVTTRYMTANNIIVNKAEIDDAEIENSTFTGNIYAPTLESYGQEIEYISHSASGTTNQANELYSYFLEAGFLKNTFYRAELSSGNITESVYLQFVEATHNNLFGQVNMRWGAIVLYNLNREYITPASLGFTIIERATNIGNVNGCNIEVDLNTQIWDDSSWGDVTQMGTYVEGGLQIRVQSGGNVLRLIDIPSSSAGLKPRQVYHENGILKIRIMPPLPVPIVDAERISSSECVISITNTSEFPSGTIFHLGEEELGYGETSVQLTIGSGAYETTVYATYNGNLEYDDKSETIYISIPEYMVISPYSYEAVYSELSSSSKTLSIYVAFNDFDEFTDMSLSVQSDETGLLSNDIEWGDYYDADSGAKGFSYIVDADSSVVGKAITLIASAKHCSDVTISMTVKLDPYSQA